MPRLDIALACDRPAGEMVDAIVEAERAGVGGVWVTDTRFEHDCFAVLGAAAARTESIVLATGVNDPYTRHPAQIAMAAATLDDLAHGRVIIGLGAGGSGLKALSIEQRSPAATVEKAIDSIRRLLAGETVTEESPGFRMENVKLHHARERKVDIAVVAHGPKLVRVASRKADVTFVSNRAGGPALAAGVSEVMEAAEGRDPALGPLRVVWRVDVALADGGNSAAELLSGRIKRLYRTGYYSGKGFLASLGVEHLEGDPAAPSDADLDDLVRALCVIGEPDEVRERLAAGVADNDFDAVCVRVTPQEGVPLAHTIGRFVEAAGDAVGRVA